MTPLTEGTYRPGDRLELFQRPALFLSASVPYRPPFSEDRRPGLIRSAVIELCRFAFTRDIDLVFGGHPAISPLVLMAARRFSPPGTDHPRVVVFQSEYYRALIPEATLELAEWGQGTLLWTEIEQENGKADEARSLTTMRRAMVASPNLVGAVFVGGMEGVFEEAELFREAQPDRPLYALGSTGGAAAALEGCTGGLEDPGILVSDRSYGRVFRRIFDDLNGVLPSG